MNSDAAVSYLFGSLYVRDRNRAVKSGQEVAVADAEHRTRLV